MPSMEYPQISALLLPILLMIFFNILIFSLLLKYLLSCWIFPQIHVLQHKNRAFLAPASKSSFKKHVL